MNDSKAIQEQELLKRLCQTQQRHVSLQLSKMYYRADFMLPFHICSNHQENLMKYFTSTNSSQCESQVDTGIFVV